MAASDEVPIIRTWSASYYLEDEKKWCKGQLILSHNCLLFREQPSGKLNLAVDIHSIADVKVQRSWLGYNTLVVVAGSRRLWFSSFDSSQSVRRIILHFVRDSLVNHQTERTGPPLTSDSGEGRTALGTELLSLAEDSQRTLCGAASQLVSQGEQLDGLLTMTDAMQRDVCIGNLHITHLESWVGLWHVPKNELAKKSPKKAQGNAPEAVEFSIVYRMSKSLVEEDGTLTFSESSVIISDVKKKVAVTFTLKEISSIMVSTPWSMVITRRLIGRPDITCHVTSASLIVILKALESTVKDKIEYDEPTDTAFTSPVMAGERITARETLLGRNSAEMQRSNEGHGNHHGNGQEYRGAEQAQVTATSQAEVVTESEADELCNVLKDLKSLAVGVGNELDVQDEKIGQLTDDVTNLTDGIKKSNQRMKQLL